MEDTFNEDGVKKIAIEHRGCRFPDEKRAYALFDIYSRDSCYVEVRQFFSFRINIPNLFQILYLLSIINWIRLEIDSYNLFHIKYKK